MGVQAGCANFRHTYRPLLFGIMTSLGFAAPGLITGTQCWASVLVAALIIQSLFFVKESPRCTKKESAALGRVVVVTGVTLMWLFWAFVYMHQLVPLIYPIGKDAPGR